jgi:hypothetical protein
VRVVDFRRFRGRLVAVVVGTVRRRPGGVFPRRGRGGPRQRTQRDQPGAAAGRHLFVRQLESRGQQLVGAAQLPSDDVALKTAAVSADQERARAVLTGHRQRIARPC